MMWMALFLMAGEETYHLGHAPKFANIVAENHADLESTIVATNEVSGTVTADREKSTGSVSLRIPVSSLKSGIAMRDEHLQGEWWLDARKHPDITFVSKKVRAYEKIPAAFEVIGDFTMHGKAKEIVVIVETRELPADAVRKAKFPEGKWIRLSAQFEVKLSDHGVAIPEVAAGKVSDTWKIKMVLFAGTAKPEKK
ncbi:MAG: YceI family protein [Planctomycetes bacterium]|nr:YceI family protein [Planctomycetota bacterium]